MWEFTYDANGMRTRRTHSEIEYQYIYNGSQLTQLTVLETGGGALATNTLYFTYSADGTPLTVTSEGEIYFYVTNIQGDVIAILDHAGRVVCRYIYDAWGNVTTDSWQTDIVSDHNPLRYRGYVYDQETQLYYLQSRYYNPKIGRFLNADALVATGQGVVGNNMFAYCNNNPINRKDETGYLAVATLCLIGALAGAAIDYATQVAANYKNGIKGSAAWTNDINVGSIVGSAFSGAVSAIPGGGVVASFVDSVGSVVIEHGVNSLLSGTQINFGEAGKEIVTNLATDALIPDFAEVEIPKYIRDIKDEAVEKGIKGTRKLQKYLDYKQVSGILFNSCLEGSSYSHRINWRAKQWMYPNLKIC